MTRTSKHASFQRPGSTAHDMWHIKITTCDPRYVAHKVHNIWLTMCGTEKPRPNTRPTTCGTQRQQQTTWNAKKKNIHQRPANSLVRELCVGHRKDEHQLFNGHMGVHFGLVITTTLCYHLFGQSYILVAAILFKILWFIFYYYQTVVMFLN